MLKMGIETLTGSFLSGACRWRILWVPRAGEDAEGDPGPVGEATVVA